MNTNTAALPMPRRLVVSSPITAVTDFDFRKFFGHLKLKTGNKVFVHGSALLKAGCITKKEGQSIIDMPKLLTMHATVAVDDRKRQHVKCVTPRENYSYTFTPAHITSVRDAIQRGSDLNAVQRETLKLMEQHHDRQYRDMARLIFERMDAVRSERFVKIAPSGVFAKMSHDLKELGDLKLGALIEAMNRRFIADAQAFEQRHGLKANATLEERLDATEAVVAEPVLAAAA